MSCSDTRISPNNFADVMGVSRSTVRYWVDSGKYVLEDDGDGPCFLMNDLRNVPEISQMLSGKWDEEMQTKPSRQYSSVELFAGAGGLALGMELAGFKHVLLNEFDHNACETLRMNRPDWNVVEEDIHTMDFTGLKGKVDFLSGGFPCQAF